MMDAHDDEARKDRWYGTSETRRCRCCGAWLDETEPGAHCVDCAALATLASTDAAEVSS